MGWEESTQAESRQAGEQRPKVIVERLHAGRAPLSRSTRARRRAAAAPNAVVVLEKRGPVDMAVAHLRHHVRDAAHMVPVPASGTRPSALREPDHKVRLRWRRLCRGAARIARGRAMRKHRIGARERRRWVHEAGKEARASEAEVEAEANLRHTCEGYWDNDSDTCSCND